MAELAKESRVLEIKRSYDIDGVLTEGVIPENPYIVISGRRDSEWKEVMALLHRLGIPASVPVYLRPHGDPADRIQAGTWKSMIIALAGIDVHFEDDPLQAQIITALARCKVILVSTKKSTPEV